MPRYGTNTNPNATGNTAGSNPPPAYPPQRTSRHTTTAGVSSPQIENANPTATPTKFRGDHPLQLSHSVSSNVTSLTPSNLINASAASASTLGLTPPTLSVNPFQSPGLGMLDSSTPISNSGSLLSVVTTRADRLRMARHDALQQHLYSSAAFWGDKVVAITGDPNDIFWLAQVYFQLGQYTRAESLLLNKKLLDTSVACRLLAAQCSIKLEKYPEALEILGEENPFAKVAGISQVKNTDGGIKLESSMCYLRGLVYMHQSNITRAKECYKEALQLDVKCFEAFEGLVGGQMMGVEEEWNFITSLKYAEQCPEDAEFIESIYMIRLKKYSHLEEIRAAQLRLESKYKLENSPDIFFSRAETLFTGGRIQECFDITSKILASDPYNFTTLPLHISCLHELGNKDKLFALSHDLVERYPDMAVSWFSVGVYYYLVGKNVEARRYFSKASTMDPRFGPAWLGFGHSFAMEGEHDQAISAYSTAARLFQGTHLPALYIGMQHLQLQNLPLAEQYLAASYRICETDPLLLNEFGVLAYNNNEYEVAVTYLMRAVDAAKETGAKKMSLWETIWGNLGHVMRRMGRYDEAKGYFEKVLASNPQSAGSYSAIGMICHLKGDIDDAITNYHQALAINPSDPMASDLLTRAFEKLRDRPLFPGLPEKLQHGQIEDDELLKDIQLSDRESPSFGLPSARWVRPYSMEYPVNSTAPGSEKKSLRTPETRYELDRSGTPTVDMLYDEDEGDEGEMDIYEDDETDAL